MRRDLAAVLEEFVATHRGLRLGRLFGTPAAFAGRRVFAKLDRRGLQLRVSSMNDLVGAKRRPSASGLSTVARSAKVEASGLPSRGLSAEAPSAKVEAARPTSDRRERAHRAPPGARPTARRSRAASWVTISPSSPAAARLEMLLEQSARYVALA